MPLFGARGALSPDITFVKLDCEGAELALLARAPRGAWRASRVTRLAFEWSFTKARNMAPFFEVVARLEADGFDVPVDPRWRELERWLASGATTSPITGKPLASLLLVPNRTLRDVIAELSVQLDAA